MTGDIEPTDEVTGDEVLQAVYNFIGRFVSYPCRHSHLAHALWILHTHLMDRWDSTPRISFQSPEPGSGKTRALEVTKPLVPRPIETMNVTPAYLLRKIGDKDGLPTILYDEIDTVFGVRAAENEEVRGLLNAGHRKGAMAGRCVVKGKVVETEELPAYAAVAMAGLGWLPATILSRSIVVRMRKRRPDEKVEPYRQRIHEMEGNAIRKNIEEWAASVGPLSWPVLPIEICDRNADVWEPLIAIADSIGGIWPERARVTAVTLVTQFGDDGAEPSLGVRLLTDIRAVFGSDEQMPTIALLAALNELEEAPWGDIKGKPLDARGLAKRLKEYGVKRKTIRTVAGTAKGYAKADFIDPWARYCNTSPLSSGNSVTGVTPVTTDNLSNKTGSSVVTLAVTDKAIVTDKTCAQCNANDGKTQAFGGVWLHRECVRYRQKERG